MKLIGVKCFIIKVSNVKASSTTVVHILTYYLNT